MIKHKNPPDFEGTTPVHLAAENGHFETCRVILHKLERSERNSSGLSPLFRAIHTKMSLEQLKLVAWRKRTLEDSPYGSSWCGMIASQSNITPQYPVEKCDEEEICFW